MIDEGLKRTQKSQEEKDDSIFLFFVNKNLVATLCYPSEMALLTG